MVCPPLKMANDAEGPSQITGPCALRFGCKPHSFPQKIAFERNQDANAVKSCCSLHNSRDQ